MEQNQKEQQNQQGNQQDKEKQNEKKSWWKWFLAGIGTAFTAILAFLLGRRRNNVSDIRDSADTVGKQLEAAGSGIESAKGTVQSIGESIKDSESTVEQLRDSTSESEGSVQQLTDSVGRQSDLVRDSQSIIDAVKKQHKQGAKK